MFSERLKELRKSNGLTQIKFAAEFHVANGTVAMWETGKREPDFETTKRIADYFGVSVDYLLGREDTQKAPTEPGERQISDEDLKFALWGDSDEIDNDDLDDVRRYAAFVAERKKKKQ